MNSVHRNPKATVVDSKSDNALAVSHELPTTPNAVPESQGPSLVKKLSLAIGGLVWAALLGTGMLALMVYSNDAGVECRSPLDLPSAFERTADENKYTAILFVHPRCPCTRSSVRQLSRIATLCDRQVDILVYFYQPESASKDWHKTDLWLEARRVSSSTLVVDVDGVQAKNFGAATSGSFLLYRPDGSLAFHGGITAGRGHEGDNAGSDAVVRIVRDHLPGCHRNPVFGCPIYAPQL